MIIHHNKRGFNSTSENLIHYINEVKEKTQMLISIVENNAFDNVCHPLIIC